MAISPVSFVNASSMVNIEESQAQSHLQEDSQKAKTQALSDVSSSGSAVAATQAFTAFQPDVQPIASLSPSTDMSTLAVPPDVGPNSNGSPTQWSGAMVDVYA
jgi:hypothetical protein